MSKQDIVTDGMRHFERAEKSLRRLVKVWKDAEDAGMLNTCGCHSLQNETLAIYYSLKALHCRGTHIAQRNDCDVPTPPDDDGGVVVQGGGGGR